MSKWTAVADLDLRRLWDQGISTAQIGKLIGVSKNAVIGRAHRIGCKGRPAPVKYRPRSAIARITGCQWLDGPGADRVFCGKPVVEGKSFCIKHCAQSYLPPKAAPRA